MEAVRIKAKKKFLKILFFSVISLSFALANFAFGQELIDKLSQEQIKEGGPVVVNAEDVEYFDKENKIFGRGNVCIDYQDIRLTADKVEVEIKKKEARAEGNVILLYKNITFAGNKLIYNFDTRQGHFAGIPDKADENKKNVIITDKDVKIIAQDMDFNLNTQEILAQGKVKWYKANTELAGENVRYNLETKKGYFTQTQTLALPWFGKAEEAEKKNEKRIDLKKAYLTTCELEKPHYRLKAKTVYLYPEDKVVAKNVLFYVGPLPIFYLPYWKQSLKDKRANVALSVGHKKNWGWFTLSAWKYDLGESLRGKIHLDYRELKGFASGVDADYDTKKYGTGLVKTYYMNERDKEVPHAGEEERYRVQAKHRWQIDTATLSLVEYNKLSDINFVKDYLYREYEKDVQPISEASLTHSQSNYNLSFYTRKRVNRFYSEVERLPEVKLDLNSQMLDETGVYYQSHFALANLNKKTANSDLDADANRFDTYNELKYPSQLPFGLEWINLAPYVGTRQTYYSKDRFGQEENFIRGSLYYGFDMNTKFYRFFPYEGRFMAVEINKLRHVVSPLIKYSYIHAPTVPREKLEDFDEIEAVDKTNFFTLGVENHLQTKWRKQDSREDLEVIDLVYFYPHIDYYPNIDVTNRHFSYYTTEMNLRLFRWLKIDTDTIFNQYQRRFQMANIDFFAKAQDKWSLSLGKRYDRDVSEQLTSELYYKINSFWQIRVYGRYESYTDTFQEKQYIIYRDLHCWLLEMAYDEKINEDGSTQDRTFWFIFRLKAFPEETPIRFSVDYETTQRY